MTDIVERLREECPMHRQAEREARITLYRVLKDAADEIEWLRGERNRLAADLAKAHLDIVAWIEKAQEAHK